MSLSLPGFKAVFPNQVYTRDRSEKSDEPLKDILTLRQYGEATQDQVVDYILTKAKEMKQKKISTGSLLEEVLVSLAPGQLEHLAEKRQDYVSLLRENCPVPDLKKREYPRHFLQLNYGSLPAEFIERHQRIEVITAAAWYDTALLILKTMPTPWGLKVRIKVELERGQVPEKFEIRTEISSSTINLKELKELLDLVYDHRPAMEKVTDISERWKEEVAATTMLMAGVEEVMQEEQQLADILQWQQKSKKGKLN